MENKKDLEPGLPAPQALAEEILTRALELTARLRDLTQREEAPQSAQDALISFGQLLLLGFCSAFARIYPEKDLSHYENEVFLALCRLTLAEILQREAKDEELEYFLTYYRSHFELLKKEAKKSGEELPTEDDALSEELRRRLEELFRRFFT